MNTPHHNSTVDAETATLTKSALFQRYLRCQVSTATSFDQLIDSYVPEDLLDDYCYEFLDDFIEELADGIRISDDPEEELNQAIAELRQYTENLQTIRDGFSAVARALRIQPTDDEPDDPVEREAWSLAWDQAEKNPRYLAPHVNGVANAS
ncbi:hypothetical protein OEW28_17235 [Defluviimonas sp. WL0002]|uniref:CdiI immunity protein domain-containing protein n=1 Tax=Albidovulum marisflavi TaxID=2984159 RepID=A0ABT2ZI04_9RHOB|nr:hypothetical protein [Defluviimonas sp. WL0002]MCV2870361.1 hypothetical protein [Defluviimonas sp. WL0002]